MIQLLKSINEQDRRRPGVEEIWWATKNGGQRRWGFGQRDRKCRSNPNNTIEMQVDKQLIKNEVIELIQMNPILHEQLKKRKKGSHTSKAENKYLEDLFK